MLSKTKVHFSHANGFPAKSYEYIFSLIDNSDIDYINIMGHANYSNMLDLTHLCDELIDGIEIKHNQPVIGMGHSSGAAATLLAAAKRPELFEKIILIDPVIFSGRKRFGIWLSQKLGLWESFSPAKRAMVRRVNFANRSEAFDYFKQKTLFKNFHPACFESYIKHGLKPTKTGMRLAFSAQVEADIFRNVPTKLPTNLSKLKGCIIYGDKSAIIGKSDIVWWRKNLPNLKIIAFDGEHLFPFESPQETASLLSRHL
jgi:pimeloyl-ACP methyl ester carboxylesterase